MTYVCIIIVYFLTIITWPFYARRKNMRISNPFKKNKEAKERKIRIHHRLSPISEKTEVPKADIPFVSEETPKKKIFSRKKKKQNMQLTVPSEKKGLFRRKKIQELQLTASSEKKGLFRRRKKQESQLTASSEKK